MKCRTWWKHPRLTWAMKAKWKRRVVLGETCQSLLLGGRSLQGLLLSLLWRRCVSTVACSCSSALNAQTAGWGSQITAEGFPAAHLHLPICLQANITFIKGTSGKINLQRPRCWLLCFSCWMLYVTYIHTQNKIIFFCERWGTCICNFNFLKMDLVLL